MCHSLAAIATHLPVLGEAMLGDLIDLYTVASQSSTDKQQELLVRGIFVLMTIPFYTLYLKHNNACSSWGCW